MYIVYKQFTFIMDIVLTATMVIVLTLYNTTCCIIGRVYVYDVYTRLTLIQCI